MRKRITPQEARAIADKATEDTERRLAEDRAREATNDDARIGEIVRRFMQNAPAEPWHLVCWPMDEGVCSIDCMFDLDEEGLGRFKRVGEAFERLDEWMDEQGWAK